MTSFGIWGMQGKDGHKTMGFSLAGLVLVAVLLLLLFGGGIAWMTVAQKKASLADEPASSARALRARVDHELTSQIGVVAALAFDVKVGPGNLAFFDAKARRIIEAHHEWRNVVLIDPNSHSMVASGLPLPTPAPLTCAPLDVDALVRTRKPMVAGVFAVGKIVQNPVILFLAPVLRGNEVRLVLAVAMDPKALSDVFVEQRLPPSWSGAVVDNHMMLAARSREPEHLVGMRATAAFFEHMGASGNSPFTATNQEGISAYTVLSRSALTGWSVLIGIPATEVEGPIRRMLLQLTVVGAALIILALALVGILGWAIVRRRNDFERALQESQSRLQDSMLEFSDLVACIPVGVYKFRMLKAGGHRFDFVSARLCEQLGVSADEVYKDADLMFRCALPEDRAELIRLNAAARASLQPFTWEGQMVGPAGKIWLHIESLPILLPNGDVLWNGIQYDITDRKRNAEQYRAIIQASLDGFWITDSLGHILEANASICKMLGYAREELLQLGIVDIEADESREETAAHIREMVETGHVQFEARHKRKDGTIINVEVSVLHLANLDDHFFAFVRDVTQRKQLEQQKEQYWRFFQLSADLMCIADPFGCFLQVNPAFVRLTQYSEGELIAKPFLEFVVPSDRLQTSEEMKLQVGLRPSLNFENRYLCKGGSIIHLSWTAFFDKTDGITYATARDVTALKQAQVALLEAHELVDQVQKLSQLGGWRYDNASRRVTWTDEVYQIYGVGKDYDSSNADNNIRFYAAEDAGMIKTAFERAQKDGEPYDLELRLNRLDGKRIWVRTGGIPLMDEDKVASVTGYIIDITERKQMELQLRIAAIAFESQEGMFITDAARRILRVNQSFSTITGYSAEEAVGQTPTLLNSGQHDAAFYEEMNESLLRCGTWTGEIWNRRKNGEIYPEWLTITAVRKDAEEITNYVATLSDITSRKASENEIKHLAYYDPLTSLPNRRLLLDRLGQALAASSRRQCGGALLFIDLDNFKVLNDTLGHNKGDLLLQQVARRLRDCVRESDSVARLGGDEFVVMLEDLSANAKDAASQAEAVAANILAELASPFKLAEYEHHCTASIGISIFADHCDTAEELLKRADLAMYDAKAAGRNTMRFFNPNMQAVISARAAMEADMHEALLKHQFVLYYQAQVTGEHHLIGAEALIRWTHPQRGMVGPTEFIALAEETGLILPLGKWVLETACTQLAAWSSRPEMANFTVAVNISARQFHQADFVNQVQMALASSGAAPNRLKLELTEGLLVSDVEDVIAKMLALKATGVSFSLDDFGTGYSSLSYLKKLPLDQLKIDQGFVRDILTDPDDAAIAKMVIALGVSLGLTVIAEGVEIEAQRDFLASLGCHLYQGYLFSRPLPLLEFEEFVTRT